MLPLATSLITSGAPSIHMLRQQNPDEFRLMLSKWLSYFPSFQDRFSRDLSRRALTVVLQASATDLGLASVKLLTYSKEDVLLQVGILSMLAADLVYKDAGDDDFEDDDDDDDYGEDIGVDGNEIGGDFGGDEDGGFDDESDKQDEAAILSQYSSLL
jgi:hypothetical protein